MYAGTVELTCVYTLTVSNGVPWNLTVVIVSSQKIFRSYSETEGRRLRISHGRRQISSFNSLASSTG